MTGLFFLGRPEWLVAEENGRWLRRIVYVQVVDGEAGVLCLCDCEPVVLEANHSKDTGE